MGKAAELLDASVPVWIWGSVLAMGLIGAQYLAYVDVATDLASADSQLHELDSQAAKLAYLNDGLAELDRFYDEVTDRSVSDAAWDEKHQNRIEADFTHWENDFRAELRRAFPAGTDRRFDAGDTIQSPGDRAKFGEYIERLRSRLKAIREDM